MSCAEDVLLAYSAPSPEALSLPEQTMIQPPSLIVSPPESP